MMLRLILVALLLCFCSCVSSRAVEGYWVPSSQANAAASNLWIHFRDDGTCEVSIPGETYGASYRVQGSTIIVRAQHEMRCTKVARDTLDCVDEAGTRDRLARAPGRPAPRK